jgi:ATP-binding cassette subfamily E protein 1
LKYFRGSELQNYFTKVLEDNLKALIKPQYVDHIPRAIKTQMSVSQMLDSKLELDNKQKLCDDLELNKVLEREVSQLSGGELQRFAIAMSCIQRADVCVVVLSYPNVTLVLPPDTCSTSRQVTWTSGND